MTLQQVPESGGALTVAAGLSLPMSIDEFDQQQALIAHVIKQMRPGKHYGGSDDYDHKQLRLPGAEYLLGAFRVVWDAEITWEYEDFKTWDFRYKAKAWKLVAPGVIGAKWEASGWSREKRFWCSKKKGCTPNCLQDHPPKGMDPGDMPHNLRTRVLKRAIVGLARAVTGTSGEFAEGMDEDTKDGATLCRIHNVAVTEKDGRFGTFWSHKNGKKWCNPKGDDLVIEATGEVPASPQDEVAEAPEKKEEE